MKLYRLIIILIFIPIIFLIGCTASDPLPEDFYTTNIYPGEDSAYNFGSDALTWSEGWFDDGYFHDIYIDNDFYADTGYFTTGLYVNGIPVGLAYSNVTTSGDNTVGRVPYFTTVTNIESSGLFWNNTTNRLGINDDSPSYTLDVNGQIHAAGDIDTDQDVNVGNQLNVVDDIDCGDNLDVGGDLTVVGSLDAPHADTHEWGGSDEVNIKDSHMIGSNVFMSPGGSVPSNFTVTQIGGGGGTAYSSIATMFVYTANPSIANDSIGYACWASDYWLDYSMVRFRYRSSGRIASASTTNNMEMWVGHFADATTFPTITSNHFGLRLIESAGAGDGNAILYASNGNGTNGTQTSIQTNVGQYDTFDYCIKYMGSDIKFYGGFNGAAMSLLATHTTNRPQYSTGNFGIWIKTFDTVQKWGQLYYFQIMPGGE